MFVRWGFHPGPRPLALGIRTFLSLWVMALVLSGCNHLFYFPSSEIVLTPERLQLDYQPVEIASTDRVRLSAWWMKPPPSAKLRRVVLHLHGNAENMSTHFLFVAWLVAEGYDVITFDYRGYGQSSKTPPTQSGLVDDTCAALAWIRQNKSLKDLPLFVIGQSLGGAVAAASLYRCPPKQLRGSVFDSTFSSYRRMARAKIAQTWIFWPLQWPLSLLVSDHEDLLHAVSKVPGPYLFFHSSGDPVVPAWLGRELFDAAPDPKEWITLEDQSHIRAFAEPESPGRAKILEFFHNTLSQQKLP